MKKAMQLLTVSFIAIIVLGMMSSNVGAITITPSTQLQAPGLDVSAFDLLYKQDVGNEGNPNPSPEGTYASSYITTFSNTAYDPQDAIITYVAGRPVISANPLYLYVKDGNHAPYSYIFNLLSLDLDGNPATPPYSWNGTDSISLVGFWPERGAISHVAIYGTPTTVSEPSTLLLLGAGLLGFGIFGRKRFRG